MPLLVINSFCIHIQVSKHLFIHSFVLFLYFSRTIHFLLLFLFRFSIIGDLFSLVATERAIGAFFFLSNKSGARATTRLHCAMAKEMKKRERERERKRQLRHRQRRERKIIIMISMVLLAISDNRIAYKRIIFFSFERFSSS